MIFRLRAAIDMSGFYLETVNRARADADIARSNRWSFYQPAQALRERFCHADNGDTTKGQRHAMLNERPLH